MSIRAKSITELTGVLAAVFLITLGFIFFMPYVFSPDVAFVFKILFELLPYILMVTLVVGVTRLKAARLGLRKSGLARQVFIGVIIFAITISFVILPLLFGLDKGNVLSFKASSLYILFYYIFKDIIFVGMGEELVGRGYFYERLCELTGSGTWAVVISSVLFGLWHYPIGQNLLQVFMTMLLGLLYGFARLKVKECTTLATGIAHGLHDAAILVLSFFLL